MRRGARIYLAASLISQAAALLRYVVLSRILGPEELGYAAMLILTSQFFESISDTGADRFIVQDARGDEPTMQGVVQLAMAGRGVMIAAALALTSGLVAHLYHAPALAPALIALGLSPLINGFLNLDLRRAQRSNDFRPEALSTIIGEVLGVAATGTAAWVVRDHTAVIYGLVARAVATVAVSHFTARRRYGWALGAAEATAFSRFALPLFLNGLLLFLGSQGDRLMVANGVGPAELGRYSAILLLVFYPANAISRFVMAMYLPQIAASRESADSFLRAGNRLASRFTLLAVALMLGFALVGPIFAPILYGKAFSQPLPIFAALAVLQAARVLRYWPTTLALATGDSLTVMLNNVARMVALPIAFFANREWPSLYAIIGGFIVGELFAMAVALARLAGQETFAATAAAIRRSGLFVAIGAAAIIASWAAHAQAWTPLAAALAAIGALLAALARWEWEAIGETWNVFARQLRRR